MAILLRALSAARQGIQAVAAPSAATHWVVHLTMALGLAATCIGWKQAVTSHALYVAEAATKNERGIAAAHLYRDNVRQARTQESSKAVVRLAAAAASNPSWAEQPVPQEVQDALAP